MATVLGAVVTVYSASPRAPFLSTGHHSSPVAPKGNHGYHFLRLIRNSVPGRRESIRDSANR